MDRPPQRAVTSLKRKGCAQMFFIYPGKRAGLVNEGAPLLAMMRNAGLGDRNLTLIADPYWENYMRGVSPEIPDVPSLVDYHRQLLRESPQVNEVYHIGHSSGCYGALLFGHLLGARKVWAFGPRTAKVETGAVAKAFLKERLSAGNGVTEYVICYSPSSRLDSAFAAYLADCPGVVLSPYNMPPPPEGATEADGSPLNVDGYYHRKLLGTIISSGDLRNFMPPLRRATG